MEDDKSHMKTLLKPAEAAALLGVSLRTVYLWCELGLIEGININGKSLRIFSQSLSKLNNNHTRGGKAEVSPPVVDFIRQHRMTNERQYLVRHRRCCRSVHFQWALSEVSGKNLSRLFGGLSVT